MRPSHRDDSTATASTFVIMAFALTRCTSLIDWEGRPLSDCCIVGDVIK